MNKYIGKDDSRRRRYKNAPNYRIYPVPVMLVMDLDLDLDLLK